MILESGDDMQHEDRGHHIHHRHHRLFQMDYFFAGSAVFAAAGTAGA